MTPNLSTPRGPRTCPAWAARLLLLLAGLAGVPAQANDFPTLERVLYVQECMREHPGSNFEMVSKCACAQEAIASEMRFEDYSAIHALFNANTIGGERGAYIRDNESLQVQIRRYREVQTRAKRACFVIR